jgi:peptidyl-dipeptidase A
LDEYLGIQELARQGLSRSQIARQLGVSDFYQMRLEFDEIEPGWLQALAEQLERDSAEPFGRVRARIDAGLAERFGLEPGQLRPWHYDDPFFQRVPAVGQLDLDPLFSRQRPEALVEATMRLAGLDLGAVLAHSDLGEREGKLAQPFCLDLDRDGDVRILASLRPSEHGTATLLHEAGHAVYHLGFDPQLPWLLRTPASPAVSEAVAVLFGRLTRDPVWLERVLGILERRLQPRLGDLRARRQADELVFVRWALVMIHFERELYRDPDQDLNRLWWQLRERYQGLESPEGRDAADWAAQAHLVVAPVYYHNYLLGRLLASQLHHRLERFGPDPLLRSEAGAWLREQLFAPGASVAWRELVNRATGEQLTGSYFLAEIGAQAGDARHGGGR